MCSRTRRVSAPSAGFVLIAAHRPLRRRARRSGLYARSLFLELLQLAIAQLVLRKPLPLLLVTQVHQVALVKGCAA